MQITKQEILAHVVLATSDYAFLTWLAAGELRMMQWSTFCLEAQPSTIGLW